MTNKYRETLIVIDFVAFDGRQSTECFFDMTYEQAVNQIWDKICPTAVILYAWKYGIKDKEQIGIKKSKLTDQEQSNRYKKY